MKIILFGATGMVGQGALRECLLDPRVERVLSVGRSRTGQQHPKLEELVLRTCLTWARAPIVCKGLTRPCFAWAQRRPG